MDVVDPVEVDLPDVKIFQTLERIFGCMIWILCTVLILRINIIVEQFIPCYKKVFIAQQGKFMEFKVHEELLYMYL